ncbi:MAG: hypothetical protein IJ214_03090 [Clostridia bacterium]|nr:hypothetical protein [Clostridia bacterium]
MKRLLALAFLLLLFACPGQADSMEEGLNRALDMVDVPALEQASGQAGIGDLLLRLARGEMVWDAGTTVELLGE